MIRIEAYAKLNLSLHVGERRADGFHSISSLVQTIDLCDRITIEGIDRGLRVENDLAGLDGKDLAERAAEAILKHKRLDEGLAIRVEKGIPAGAGLGGGSSDAAAVLSALDSLLEPEISSERLGRLATELGSDVPLFLRGGLLRVGGRGELVSEVGPSIEESLLIVVPPVHCATGVVYRQFDEISNGNRTFDGLGENALLEAALAAYPELAPYRDAMNSLDADYAGMSGSGSSFFAAFADASSRARAREQVARMLPEARTFECAATETGHRRTGGEL